jgi:3-oxoacyl-[acyl-carrier-protein] synthase II
VTAVKGCTGHMVGGSGAVEAIVTLRSLSTGLVPPVAGLGMPDPALDLDVVAGRPRQVGGGHALSTSFGFGGQNAALVLAGP